MDKQKLVADFSDVLRNCSDPLSDGMVVCLALRCMLLQDSDLRRYILNKSYADMAYQEDAFGHLRNPDNSKVGLLYNGAHGSPLALVGRFLRDRNGTNESQQAGLLFDAIKRLAILNQVEALFLYVTDNSEMHRYFTNAGRRAVNPSQAFACSVYNMSSQGQGKDLQYSVGGPNAIAFDDATGTSFREVKDIAGIHLDCLLSEDIARARPLHVRVWSVRRI